MHRIVLILAMMAFALQHVQVAAQREAQVQEEAGPTVQARPSIPPEIPTPAQQQASAAEADEDEEEVPPPLGASTQWQLASPQPAQFPYLPGNRRAQAVDSAQSTRPSQSELQKAIAQLRASETESDREKAEDAMRLALSEDYDASLDKYEEYLEQMEAKIKQLKNQLEKRRQAKMELVDLRLQMLVNEANGLGWPNSRTNGVFGQNFNVGGPPWLQPVNPFEQRSPARIPNLSGDVFGR